jgi:hypothetical protein
MFGPERGLQRKDFDCRWPCCGRSEVGSVPTSVILYSTVLRIALARPPSLPVTPSLCLTCGVGPTLIIVACPSIGQPKIAELLPQLYSTRPADNLVFWLAVTVRLRMTLEQLLCLAGRYSANTPPAAKLNLLLKTTGARHVLLRISVPQVIGGVYGELTHLGGFFQTKSGIFSAWLFVVSKRRGGMGWSLGADL